MEYKYNQETNSVTAIMHSNEKIGDTKPTWILSKDALTYTKEFYEDISYSTPVEDIYGNSTDVVIEINQISVGPVITMEYQYNASDNTVTGIMHSNKKLKNTKIAWVLSDDALTYTTILRSNGSYTTTVEDMWGNETSVLIDVTRN